ncbi:hypothetical protein C8R43DRAFT_1136129 [Mycena crocata]|nr:hypothetical protein C8R43DRAFT_1136129 [Mycena crocata]
MTLPLCPLWSSVASLVRSVSFGTPFNRALEVLLDVCNTGPLSIALHPPLEPLPFVTGRSRGRSPPPESSARLGRILSKLAHTSHRWDRFSFRSSNLATLCKVLDDVAAFHPPDLLYFRVQYDAGMSSAAQTALLLAWTLPFPTSFAALQTFDLSGLPYPPFLPPMPALRHLFLRGVAHYSWPIDSQLLRIFTTSPAISVLALRGIGIVSSDGNGSRLLVLPSILHLQLWFGLGSNVLTLSLSQFLRTLVFPCLQTLDLCFANTVALEQYLNARLTFRASAVTLRGAVYISYPMIRLYCTLDEVTDLDLRRAIVPMLCALGKPRPTNRLMTPAGVLVPRPPGSRHLMPFLRRLTLRDPVWADVLSCIHARRSLGAPPLSLLFEFTSVHSMSAPSPERDALRPLVVGIECRLYEDLGSFSPYEEIHGYF